MDAQGIGHSEERIEGDVPRGAFPWILPPFRLIEPGTFEFGDDRPGDPGAVGQVLLAEITIPAHLPDPGGQCAQPVVQTMSVLVVFGH